MGAIFLGRPIECFLKNSTTFYSKVEDVLSSIETTILQYTVPINMEFTVTGGSASGMTDTEFKLYIDGNIKEVKRIAWTERNVTFNVAESVSAGKIIKITCIHSSLGNHNFDASLFGIFLSV